MAHGNLLYKNLFLGASLPEKIREQENRDNTFTLKTSLFGQRNVILESDLTLLNVNRDIQKIHKQLFSSLIYYLCLYTKSPERLITGRIGGNFFLRNNTMRLHKSVKSKAGKGKLPKSVVFNIWKIAIFAV